MLADPSGTRLAAAELGTVYFEFRRIEFTIHCQYPIGMLVFSPKLQQLVFIDLCRRWAGPY
jgi:hypothetical protein